MTADAIKAGALLLFAALVQVSIASAIEVAEGHPDIVLVLVIGIALLRGPVFRLGDVTTKSSAHPSLVAVALGTVGFALGSAVVHFMLGSTLSAVEFFVGVLLPTLALNMLLAYPLYGICRRIFHAEPRERREVSPAV